jgi:arthrofactin-type cyclic lipopeptide synthetase C
MGGGTRNIRRESLGLPVPFEPPEGDLETAIAEIFADAFDIDRIGANDDFFDLGGDSLIAAILSMRVAEHAGCEFPVSSVLENGSPRRIAALLSNRPSVNAAKRMV